MEEERREQSMRFKKDLRERGSDSHRFIREKPPMKRKGRQ